MSKLGKLLGLIVLLGLFVPAQAQAQFGVGVYGGLGLPVGPYGDFVDSGFSGGIGAWYGFGRLGIGADFVYASYKAADGSTTLLPLGGFDQTNLHYDASLYINLLPADSNTFFWIDAGLGASTISFKEGDRASEGGVKPESQTAFTIPLGLGIGYNVSESVGLFLRSRAYIMMVDDQHWEGHSTLIDLPIWLGIAFGFGGGE